MHEINRILNNPKASQWLKDAVKSALQRSPSDSAYDAELLSYALNLRLGLLERVND